MQESIGRSTGFVRRAAVYSLVLSLSFAGALHALDAERDDRRVQSLAELRTLSDQELSGRAAKLFAKEDFYTDEEYEPCLTEIVRRASKGADALLRDCLDALMKRTDKPDEETGSNLELLTTIRRLQKRPDPLTIEIDDTKLLLSVGRQSLPRIKVALKNVDADKLKVGIKSGGDYRSGRQARWRIHVVDEKGRVLPVRTSFGMIGGGILGWDVLAHGESWDTVLELRSFIEPPQPGKYKLQVLYHNRRTIAEMESVDGLVMCKSAVVPLQVEPTVIALTQEEQRTARSLVTDLNPADKLQVLDGQYGSWAHKSIRPDSTQGKLLTAGLKSVPALVEALQDEAATPEKRAWIFSLLFTITGENDPRFTGAVANFQSDSAPWQVWGGKHGQSPSGGLGTSSQLIIPSGKLDVNDQKRMTEVWLKWLKSCTVKIQDKWLKV